jgi:predicted dinucleotide-binding enzyme
MKIVTIGRGNVGGGLAELWRAAGHDVTELGRDGGDAADAEAVLLAVPAAQIDAALDKVQGLGRAPRPVLLPHLLARRESSWPPIKTTPHWSSSSRSSRR